MAFPPNYNQNRKDRERAKNKKAQEKQARREEKNRERKTDQIEEPAADQAVGKENQ
jgi:hypothetical protein